jgi:hypothetical protein
MVRHVVVYALWIVPVFSFAQIYIPTPPYPSQLLQSGVMLGTEQERHYSIRMDALGKDFSGTIEDQITDLYRNPAYFAKVENPVVMGELVRPYYSNEPPAKVRVTPNLFVNGAYNTPENVGSSTGLRCAYLSQFGLLLRTTYNANTFAANNTISGVDPWSYQGSLYSDQTRSSNGYKSTLSDIQLSYGFTVNEVVSAGVSYTFGSYISDNSFGTLSSTSRVLLSTTSVFSDSLWSGRGEIRTMADNLIAHTFRFGVHWENMNNRVEAVGIVEMLNGTSEQVQSYNYGSYEAYRWTDTARLYVYGRQRVEAGWSTENIKGTNIRFDLRYHQPVAEGRTFTAQLGGGVAFFSADGTQRVESRYVDTTSSYYTSGSSMLSRWTRITTPDGFGFQVNASVGWTFPVSPFLLAAGMTLNVGHTAFDYDAQRSQTDTLHQWFNGSDSLVRTLGSISMPAHSSSVLILRIALPIAMEVEALKDFHIRAGWVPQYVRNVNEDISDENGFRKSSDNLDVTTMTFGLGYQIFQKLRIDMANYGDLAQPRSWNIAAQYDI